MKRIKIGVFYHDIVEKENVNIDGVSKYGTYDYINQVIEIREGMTKDRKSQTLLHEIIHVIDMDYSIELTETQIECLATGLLQVLKENELCWN